MEFIPWNDGSLPFGFGNGIIILRDRFFCPTYDRTRGTNGRNGLRSLFYFRDLVIALETSNFTQTYFSMHFRGEFLNLFVRSNSAWLMDYLFPAGRALARRECVKVGEEFIGVSVRDGSAFKIAPHVLSVCVYYGWLSP